MKRDPGLHHYLIQTLDPVHIGTGEMRIGGIDNTIVRETGTNLPKIPGSSLKGVIRSYAAFQQQKPDCAGVDIKGKPHCNKEDCIICYTFGSKERGGVVGIGDARILLFPVHSMKGPIWITSPMMLFDSPLRVPYVSIPNDTARRIQFKDREKAPDTETRDGRINLSWLMLKLDSEPLVLDREIQTHDHILDRVYLVSDATLSQAVNSNLEVRTSVSIDPRSGTAEDKALFTYEAIPRACILWCDVVIDEIIEDGDKSREPKEIINKAIEWLETLGIGGMGSRGFGRIKMTEWSVKQA
ncbi:MAG: type III-B CRISPR module RAMP protein Cmr4 [Candidatus Thorarchaeota archaeon]